MKSELLKEERRVEVGGILSCRCSCRCMYEGECSRCVSVTLEPYELNLFKVGGVV